MWKKAIFRAVVSMAVTSLSGQVFLVAAALFLEEGAVPLVPSYRACFQSDTVALGVHVLLTGVIGAAFGGFSVLLEIERWSFLKAGALHFALTAAVWLPIAVFLWGLNRYPTAVLTTFLSFTLTYGVTWWLSYRKYRRTVRQINEKLQTLRAQLESGE